MDHLSFCVQQEIELEKVLVRVIAALVASMGRL